MSAQPKSSTEGHRKAALSPFRRAILRGLAVVMPPLLTIVLFLWVWNAIEINVLTPMEQGAESVLVWAIADTRAAAPPGAQETSFEGRPHVSIDGKIYTKLDSGKWIPAAIVETVSKDGSDPAPVTAEQFYRRYVQITYLRRVVVIPCFLLVFVIVLYLMGKFMAAGVGRILWNPLEALIHRLPVVRNVYSSVKQVTDFIFSEPSVEFNRVVAVQYPRKGIWSIGFVTGESMLDISAAANEPVLSVLMPTSPMPATGFTITVSKSETIDLNLTVDQAIQFIVSCGVVVPPQQLPQAAIEGTARSAAQPSADGENLSVMLQPKPNGNGSHAVRPDEEAKKLGNG